jgi:hypothetical protein
MKVLGQTIWSSSIYGVQNRRGLVAFSVTDDATEKPIYQVQLTPDDARKVALQMLEAASAAEFDEVIVDIAERITPPGKDSDVSVSTLLQMSRLGRAEMYERKADEHDAGEQGA